MEKKTVIFQLSEELYNNLCNYCNEKNKSKSEVIRRSIRKYIHNDEDRISSLLEKNNKTLLDKITDLLEINNVI